MLVIKKFFCFQLHTAGLVIGCLSLAESLIYFAIFIAVLCGVTHSPEYGIYPGMNLEQLKTAQTEILATMFPLIIVDFITSILVIIGTTKKKHLFLLPWMISFALDTLYELLIFTMTMKIMMHPENQISTFIVSIIVDAFGLMFAFYCWIAIYSLYKKMKYESKAESQDYVRLTTAVDSPS